MTWHVLPFDCIFQKADDSRNFEHRSRSSCQPQRRKLLQPKFALLERFSSVFLMAFEWGRMGDHMGFTRQNQTTKKGFGKIGKKQPEGIRKNLGEGWVD